MDRVFRSNKYAVTFGNIKIRPSCGEDIDVLLIWGIDPEIL
jgi:hypothetical protein